jgi:two-component system response regulator RpfG
LLAQALRLPERVCEDIELAAPMHDIGKVGIPDSILLKEGPLDEREMAIMKEHPAIGYEILKNSPSRYITLGAEIALSHHEKYDGSGYPNGLEGENIPLAGRIVAVADVYDALTTRRPYKEAWPVDDAVDYIRNASGSHLDPLVVEAFLNNLDEVIKIQSRLSDD